ncbi:MAG: hypothetical protein HY010_03720 [Acidobacteria bacterium]|nr:hypothetical protein [Acidobacteriota bacterium]
MPALIVIVLVMLISIASISDISMKVAVNNRLPPEERFSWWNRDGWRVAKKYKELFPDSYLPVISQCSFGLVFAIGLVLLIVSVTDTK